MPRTKNNKSKKSKKSQKRIFKKFRQFDKTELKLKNGEKLNVINYISSKKNKKSSVDRSEKFIKTITKEMKKQNKEFHVAVLLDIGWKSINKGFLSDPKKLSIKKFADEYTDGEDMNLLDDLGTHMISITYKDTSTEGGSDKHNDCLYNCIKRVIGDIPNMKYPKRLKNYLKLDREAKVPVILIPKLEEKLNIRINVFGSSERSTYISSYKSNTVVDLKLENGHYTNIYKQQKGFKVIRKNKNEYPLLVYKISKNIVDAYDGLQIKTYDYVDFQQNILKYEKRHFHNVKPDKDLVEEYNKYKQYATELNLDLLNYKSITGYILQQMFYNFQKVRMEDISQKESNFIKYCLTGGLLYFKEGVYENVKCYDVNSMYPYIMQSAKVMFPLREGEFQSIENRKLPEYFKYGIYRAEILGNINKLLFNKKRNDFYTHYELNRARELGYTIHMRENVGCNAIIYDRKDLISGKQLFGKYINDHYDLKKKNPDNKVSKMLLNKLWGLLSQRNVYIETYEKYEGGSNDIEGIHPYNDTHLFNAKQKQYYKTPMARIAPFLTGMGRVYISRIMENLEHDKIYRCHTDGFICDGKINITKIKGIGNDKELSKVDMGGLKIEYTADKVSIRSVNGLDIEGKVKY